MKDFLKKYRLTYTEKNGQVELSDFLNNFHGFGFVYQLISECGGQVFNNGLFKIHTFDMVSKWTTLLTQSYFKDELENRQLICFASNWQGCMYCVNRENTALTYFDPATCEFFSSDGISLSDFFDDILINGEYDIIFEEYYDEAIARLNFDKLDYQQSVGHKIYLHLGGEDSVDNLEVVDTAVLWEMQIQIAERINDLNEE